LTQPDASFNISFGADLKVAQELGVIVDDTSFRRGAHNSTVVDQFALISIPSRATPA
jgi:hypothetical protein